MQLGRRADMTFKLPAGAMLQNWDNIEQTWVDHERLKGDETIEPGGVFRGDVSLVTNERQQMHAKVDGIMMMDTRADGSGLVLSKPGKVTGNVITGDPFSEDTAALAIKMARLNPDKNISIGLLM